jgi:hypothetical protein
VQIRKEQIDAFRLAAEHDYEIRLVRFLQGRFPDAAREPEATLLEGVRPQIANARGYGLITEQQIATYVTAAWLLGADFDREFPAAQQMLVSGAPADENSDWLARFTKELFKTLEQRN